MSKTFEELNGMTRPLLIDYAGQHHVPNFKKSSKKADMIEAICSHIGCVRSHKEEREARSRSRSRSRSPSGSRSQESKLRAMGITDLKKFVKDKNIKIKGISTMKSADKAKLILEIIEKLGGHSPVRKPRTPSPKKDGKKCEDGKEVSKKTGKCINKCKDDEERNEATGKCKKVKVSDKKPKVKTPPRQKKEENEYKNKSDSYFAKIKTDEILEKLKEEGILDDLPSLKKDRIQMLKADRCDPENEDYCEGDEECQIPNGVCMPSDKRTKGWDEMEVNGKKIVGSKESIASLRSKLSMPERPKSSSRDRPRSPSPVRPRSPSPVRPKTPPRTRPAKKEKKVDDIQKILRDLNDDGEDDLSNLDAFQQELIKCLFKS